ncbi:MAG: 16S rRNA (cytosine1402-N4)-methyltransferase, partial [Planctomycetota bacterium]
GWIVDGTLGAAGHASACLETFEKAQVLGIDQDPEILEIARERLTAFGDRSRTVRGRISELDTILESAKIGQPNGMLFDLGVSSLQLDRAERGFSFAADGPLDMRMDPERDRTAADIINHWDEADLADLFYYEGDESRSRSIAKAIVQSRRRAPFKRTSALAELIASQSSGGGKTHPATRCFQALRRAVNEEGEELLSGLDAAAKWLAEGASLVVISFHSGEDRAVKKYFADGARAGDWRLLTKKPLSADREECRRNRRSRSARVRAAVRTRAGGAS